MTLPRLFFSVLAFSSAALLLSGQSQPPLLTLSDALDLAKKQNPQVRIATFDIHKAVQQTDQLKTQRLPVFKIFANVGESVIPINLTIPAGVLGVYPATGPIPAKPSEIQTKRQVTGFIYGSLAQPLSQLYKIHLALTESHLAEEAAREKLRQQVQDASQQVRQAYYQLAQLQTQLTAAQASLDYLTELSKFVDRNLAQETVLRSDSLNVKAKLSQQQFQILALRNRYETQKEALNRLLGRDLRTDFTIEVAPSPSAAEETLEAAQSKALAQRPELRQARLQTQKSIMEIRREHAEFLPDISAQASYLSFPNLAFFPKNVLVLGVSLSWQPFDWGQRRHKIAELNDSSEQAKLTERDAEQQVLLDVNNNFRNLAEARARLAVDETSQELEREKLRVVTNKFKEKSALLTDVLQEQSALAQADAQYRQDLETFWTTKGAFEKALGEQ